MFASQSILFAVLGIAVVVGFVCHPILGAIALIITLFVYYRNLKTVFTHYSRRRSSSQIPLISDLAEDIDPVISHCNRGKFRYQTGNIELAIEDFNRTIELDPDTIEAHYYRGLCKQKLGDLAAAKQDLQQAAILANERSNLQFYEQILSQLRGWEDRDSEPSEITTGSSGIKT